jgi:hypothetical protein
MGHAKIVSLCFIALMGTSCAIGMRTHQTYASEPDGTVTKIGGAKAATAKAEDGKPAKESAPLALQTGGSNELYVAFARDTHSMDNAETSIEKRTSFVEDGSTEMVGNPYGYGGGYYDPVYAAAAAYTQAQMPGAMPTAKSADVESANEKADNAVAAQAATAEEVAKQAAEIEKLKKDKKKSK